MLLFEAFPRKSYLLLPVHRLTRLPDIAHAHLSLSLPHLEAVSTTPIMFRAIASLDAVVTKLSHFIDSSALPAEEQARIRHTIESGILPFLKHQISPPGKSTVKPLSSLSPLLTEWVDASKSLTSALPAEQLFPVIDLWRIGFLSATVGAWVSEECANTPGVTSSIIFEFLNKAELKPLPRSFVLTLSKCFSNALGALPLSRQLLAPGPLREKLTDLAISQLLEEDHQVRATAASLVFNIASCTQAQRTETGKNNSLPQIHTGPDAEWEIEVVSAIIEGIRREESEEICKFSVGSKRHTVKST